MHFWNHFNNFIEVISSQWKSWRKKQDQWDQRWSLKTVVPSGSTLLCPAKEGTGLWNDNLLQWGGAFSREVLVHQAPPTRWFPCTLKKHAFARGEIDSRERLQSSVLQNYLAEQTAIVVFALLLFRFAHPPYVGVNLETVALTQKRSWEVGVGGFLILTQLPLCARFFSCPCDSCRHTSWQ